MRLRRKGKKKDPAAASEDKALKHDRKVDEDEQPLLTHLVALRKSLLRSVIAVVVVFFSLFYWANDLYAIVAAPLLEHLPGDTKMIATAVASPFLTPFKLTAYLALFISMPFILHQIWSFVAPGLYLKEKKFALPLLFTSILLFYLGMLFAYFLVFPLAFAFFAATIPENVAWMTDIHQYLSFVIKIVFAFGVIFEIPIATLLLILAGFSTPQSLGRKRPYIIVGCFFVGMILTPPDIISQVLLAIPAWILFELGILFGRLFVKKEPEETPEAT